MSSIGEQDTAPLIDLSKLLVLVGEDSDNILRLTEECKNKLLIKGNEKGSDKHTLEFQPPHSGKVLKYHTIVRVGKGHKRSIVGLFESWDNHSGRGDAMVNWSFNGGPFLTTEIQREEYFLDVNMATMKEGSNINVIHTMSQRRSIRKLEHEHTRSFRFQINDDGSISPQESETNKSLYLGIKGAMKDQRELDQFAGQIEIGRILQNDKAYGHDLLGENVVATCLANRIAQALFSPPFALGIFGEWGAGKSTFFELMKKRLIEIQKVSVPDNPNNMKYVGHLYLVEFSAWTYYRGDNIWPSLMYRIFNDLNDQLEIEDLIDYCKEGQHSPIQLNEMLNSGEKEYLRKILEEGGKKDINDLVRGVKNGLTCESFAKVFASNVEGDRNDLKKARAECKAEREKFEDSRRAKHWKTLKDNATNRIQRKLVNKFKEEFKDERKAFEELAKSRATLEELFNAKFTLLDKFLFHMESLSIFSVFLIVIAVAISVACCWVWFKLRDNINALFTSTLTSVASVLFTINNIIVRGKNIVKEQTEKFADVTNAIQMGVATLRAEEMNEQTTLLVNDDEEGKQILENIQEKEKEITQIQNRLRVLKGQSVRSVVKGRVDSDKYESMLGIVHTVKEDLDTLRDAMFNKYTREEVFTRGKPRIVLFVDDLDRCDPDKVVDVLEALQLLVKTDLFVIVAAIDLQYLCSSLEKKKYKDILHSHQVPTGLDYLEKIFQVAYRVPAVISDENMRNYIDNQTAVIADKVPHESHDIKDRVGKVIVKGGQLDSAIRIPDFWYTKEDALLLKESCLLFKLTPRATKRIINVLTLIKEIEFLKGERSDSGLLRDNLLLLVMAASSETKIEIQRLFRMMEMSTMPKYPIPEQGANTHLYVYNLCELVMHTMRSSYPNMNEFRCINELEKHKYTTRSEWKGVSDKFHYARSFSFLRRSGDQEEKRLLTFC